MSLGVVSSLNFISGIVSECCRGIQSLVFRINLQIVSLHHIECQCYSSDNRVRHETQVSAIFSAELLHANKIDY